MKTTTDSTIVNGKAAIWATPISPEEMKELGLTYPFKYQILTGDYSYYTGYVKVVDVEIQGLVPEGINLIEKALETLQSAKQKAHIKYLEECRGFDAQIQDLLRIQHIPETEHNTFTHLADEQGDADGTIVEPFIVDYEEGSDTLDNPEDHFEDIPF